jgi:Putative auto-transporter adhesin, head GIN domain
MRHLTIAFLLLFGIFSTTAQTEEIKVKDFKVMYVFGPFKVNLVKSDMNKVEIDYNGIDAEEVLVKSKEGELSIKLRNRNFFDFGNNDWERKNHRFAKVTIHYKEIMAIEARAGAIVRANETIEVKELFLVSKMGADMRLDVKVQKLELESSMGSEVKLTGTTETLKIKSKMGSEVDASYLQSQDVMVSSSMGSQVSVFAEKELDASADFGASITYRGNPSMKHTSRFLGAEVNPTKR